MHILLSDHTYMCIDIIFLNEPERLLKLSQVGDDRVNNDPRDVTL